MVDKKFENMTTGIIEGVGCTLLGLLLLQYETTQGIGFFCTICGIGFFLYSAFTYSTYHEKWERERQQQAEANRKRKRRHKLERIARRYDTATAFYIKCCSMGIKELNGNEDRIRMIAETDELVSAGEALSLFQEGCSPKSETLASLRSLKHLEEIEQEKKRNSMQDVDLIGRDKYTHQAKKDIQRLTLETERFSDLKNGLSSGSIYLPEKKQNVKIAAMKGQFIGGPAAGVASALEAQRRNEDLDSAAKARQNASYPAITKHINESLSKKKAELACLQGWVNSYQKLLVNTSETDLQFKNLNITIET